MSKAETGDDQTLREFARRRAVARAANRLTTAGFIALFPLARFEPAWYVVFIPALAVLASAAWLVTWWFYRCPVCGGSITLRGWRRRSGAFFDLRAKRCPDCHARLAL